MGSFAYTCAVSGLPIHAGDAVRFFLVTANPYSENKACQACTMHDWWFPRTFPLRAKYNDYGSVEDVEAGPAQDIWLEGFKTDLVTRGWGDNSVHDVPVTKDMTFDQLLGAVQEGRVLVQREVGGMTLAERRAFLKMKTPKGVPTLKRVQAKLVKAGLPLFQGWGTPGFLVDRKGYGTVRVRWHGEGAEWAKDVPHLKEAKKALKRYATIIRAGTGSYANSADLFVHVKPGTKDFHGAPKDKKTPLLVSQAMIREDVWQALLKLEIHDRWGSEKGKKTVDDFRKAISKTYKDALKKAQSRKDAEKALADLPPDADPKLRQALGSSLQLLKIYSPPEPDSLTWIVSKDVIPFTVALGAHWNLFADKMVPAQDAAGFIDSVAEMAYVHQALMWIRYIWVPSSSRGPQFGEWGKHAAFHAAMSEIAKLKHAEDQEE